jgi:uncharacterized protein
MVFMFASTNLVAELGIVLWLLIGWQFTLAQFVGGAIMIVLLGLALPRLVPRGWTEAARRRLEPGAAEHDGHGEHGSPGGRDTLAGRLRQRPRWADAADNAIADLTMLRRDLVVGFVVAGFAAVAVPVGFWNAVFLHHHGALTVIENAVAGPFVAMISFTCATARATLATSELLLTQPNA